MKQYFTLLMIMILPVMMMAQEPNKSDREKFNPEEHKQKQQAFMTEKAQLTDEEANKFFAIYDEMRMKERELFGNSHEMRMKRPETDAECRAAMLHADSLELATKQLQVDYHKRLLNAISAKKASIAIMAGDEFDRMTFREMMRDWKRSNKGDKNGQKAKGNNKLKNGMRHDMDGFDGPHPRHDFHAGRPDGPDMEGAPDGPRPDGPAPDNSSKKDSK